MPRGGKREGAGRKPFQDVPKTQVSWRIRTDLVNRLDDIAKEERRTKADIVETALQDYLSVFDSNH